MKREKELYPGIYLIKENNLCGCVDVNGNVIIPTKYDIVSVFDCAGEKQIICGRDGKQYTGYIYKSNNEPEHNIKSVYTGVYDLYNHEGRLKIGGFIELKYNKDFKAYLLKYGHNYEYREGNGTASSPYKFKLPYGEWILLSSWFCSFFSPSGFRSGRTIRHCPCCRKTDLRLHGKLRC